VLKLKQPLTGIDFIGVKPAWRSTVIGSYKKRGGTHVNNIIYIVGLVVVVLFVAGYLGLR